MFIDVIKCLHLVCALSLCATIIVTYCIGCSQATQIQANGTLTQTNTSHRFILFGNYAFILLALFQMISGGLLVFPKGYTFATPWINAAFTGVSLMIALIILEIIKLKKNQVISRQYWHINHGIIFIILIAIIHDAVMKHTLWGS